MANRLCVCSRCIAKQPGGWQVSKSSYFRHRQEQQNRLPPEERQDGLHLCTSCPAFPNGHYTSRPTYYRHIQHHRLNASASLVYESDELAPLDERSLTPLSPGQISSSTDERDQEADNHNEEEDTNERRLLNTLLADGDEQELLFNMADDHPDSSLDLFLRLADWSDGVSREKYQQLRRILTDCGINLPSMRKREARLRGITKIEPRLIHCCFNSCMAFTGTHSELRSCLRCREPRYQSGSTKPRKVFVYVPLIWRLQLQYQNAERARVLKSYRHSFTNPDTHNARRVFRDVFDGDLYRDFHVRELDLFKNPHDIALHLSLDGVDLTTGKIKHQVTPVILCNLNLPPEVRYEAKNILACLIIPGPKKYKNIDSFLRPLVDELHQLGRGVESIDGDNCTKFDLRAWVILVTGDGPAAADAAGMKTPGNAKSPCRTCEFKGQNRDQEHYYYPHTEYDISNLPIRTALRNTISLLEEAESEALRTEFGITRSSILLELQSIHFPRSFPIDIMHCVLQNITPMLFDLWNGRKLKADAGTGNSNRPPYWSSEDDAKDVGMAMVKARPQIPGYLGHAPRQIDVHYSSFKAAEWKAWLLLFGVPLLDQRLHEGYLANFRTLSQLYALATQQQVVEDDINQVRDLAKSFVRTFEHLYYCGQPNQVSVCTLQIHSLLHFASYMRDFGPACYFWQFPMERYCGIIKPKARSKSQLSSSISNAVVINEHLNHRFFAHPNETPQSDLPQLPLLLDEFCHQPTPRQLQGLGYLISRQVDRFQSFKRCKLQEGLIIGSQESQRVIDINRSSHRICYRARPGGPFQFGEVQFFANVGGPEQWAYVKPFTNISIDRPKRVASYQGIGASKWIKVRQILSLIGIVLQAGVNLIVTDVNLFAL